VVVTGNHFVLDTIGGLFLGLVALIVARRMGRQGRQRKPVFESTPRLVAVGTQ
jgi:hypothetical protein